MRRLYIRELTGMEIKDLYKSLQSSSAFTHRRCQILISSAEGKSVREISRSLFCSDQCVRDAISNFNKDGLRCIYKKRNKKNKTSAFSQAALKSLEKIVSHPPSYYGLKSELWNLEILANVCYKQKVINKPVSSRTVGFILKKIGLNWKQIKKSMRNKKMSGSSH